MDRRDPAPQICLAGGCVEREIVCLFAVIDLYLLSSRSSRAYVRSLSFAVHSPNTTLPKVSAPSAFGTATLEAHRHV